ncbi:AAA family ATPase [Dactylosporangium cerinum]
MLTLPEPCVVVLVGPGAAGKSTWAQTHFAADRIVSSDRLRALVGAGEDDITASADAFAVLDTVVAQRLRRRLTTVIDTLGLDAQRRAGWVAAAKAHGLPCVAIAFDTPPAQCRARNRARTTRRIPADVLTQQLRAWAATRDALPSEGSTRCTWRRRPAPSPRRSWRRPRPTTGSGTIRRGSGSGCTSGSSRASTCGRPPRPPRRPGSTRST